MTGKLSRRKTIAAGASLALAAAMIGAGLTSPSTSVLAAPGTSGIPGAEQIRQEAPAAPKPSPKPGRGNPGDRQQHQEAYLNALAARLGISVDQLQAAMKQARIDTIEQAVTEGRLTREQADRMIQAIQSGQRPGPGAGPQGPRGPQGPGQGQRGPGRPGGPGMPGAGQAAATALGITPEQLRTELQAGKSLAQIAQEKGVSRDDLKAKLLEAHKTRVDAAVAAGRMTAEQGQEALARATANIDRMIDATPGQRRGPRTPGSGN
jgi:hypothetical protein